MPLRAPNLDDRDFARILAEAKSLIPRYAPEWTDHNESDPGITLIELFAWMTEMLLFKLNQVPERNYIEFLKLIGVELKPAEPARAELTFALARNDLDTVIVPKGTQVGVAGGSGGRTLVFETEQALVALGAKLKAIQSFDGFSYAIETKKNEAAGQFFYPFGAHAREGSALLLGFDSPISFTKAQINLMVYVFTLGAKSEGRHYDMDLSRQPLPAAPVWEYWDRKYWEPLSLDKDETRAFTRSGHLYFSGPGDKIKKDRLGDVAESLYWIRCRLEQSAYEQAPRLETIITNTVTATEAVTVRNEIVGGSNGRANQPPFRLANAPVVRRDKPEKLRRADGITVTVTSLLLEIDEGQQPDVWQEVTDFYSSGPDDPHYVLNRTTGEIRFGDGRHGRIPVANPTKPNSNIIARHYRYGGGKDGNVGVDAITELKTFIQSVDRVTNKRASLGGKDEETLEDAKLRAPREIKSKQRAVTAEDFELLALESPGARVRRAKALPLVHPKYPDARIPGVVTVIIVPDSDSPKPTPGEATLSAVCSHLNQHRLLTTEVYSVAPTYRRVKIEADIIASPEADLAEVKRAVEERLNIYFHPLIGGETGDGWPFGRDIFYSDVYRIVLQTSGVARIENNEMLIWLDDERQTFCRDVTIGAGVLLYCEQQDIRVTYSQG